MKKVTRKFRFLLYFFPNTEDYQILIYILLNVIRFGFTIKLSCLNHFGRRTNVGWNNAGTHDPGFIIFRQNIACQHQ